MNAIEFDHLSRKFGRNTVLNDLTFTVPTGSFFALLGPNGAGKSTTLKIALNLLAPTTGEARVLGKPSTSLRAEDFRRIGYIADGQDLPDWMKGSQFLAYCRSFYPEWDHDLANRLTREFRVPMDRAIKHLSRGQRMQISLLSTLPYRPELLLLDEPFSGLDPLVRDDLIQGFLELPTDDRPGTVVISSHDIDEVERLTDEVAFLAESRLLIRESSESLRARFRRIEIVSANPVISPDPSGCYEQYQPSANVLQLTIGTFHESTTTPELAGRYPGAAISVRAMTLREIFLAIARHERLAGMVAA